MIEAPLADGCTCNPAVMRQHQNHTPHTLSPIMYIINALKKKKKKMLFPPFSECTSRQRAVISSINADRAIKSQKVKSKSRHQPTEREPSLVVSLFLMRDSWERLFLQTSTNAEKEKKKKEEKKKRLSLSCSIQRVADRTAGQREGRQPWPCYFCSSYRKRETRGRNMFLYGEKSHCSRPYSVCYRASLS